MIKEFLFMNGYGLYVWSAFAFTLLSFLCCLELFVFCLFGFAFSELFDI